MSFENVVEYGPSRLHVVEERRRDRAAEAERLPVGCRHVDPVPDIPVGNAQNGDVGVAAGIQETPVGGTPCCWRRR